MITKFPAGHTLAGYGYDAPTARLISYKRKPEGVYLDYRTSYNLNGHTVTSYAIADAARTQATKDSAVKVEDTIKGAPNFPYVMYSAKNQCSQFFFANTSIAEALAKFARRGEVIASKDIRIVNVTTGQPVDITKKVVTTETYVFG